MSMAGTERSGMERPGVSDRALAALLLAACFPVMLAAALLVLLSGPGEVAVRMPFARTDGRLSYRLTFRVFPRFAAEHYDAMQARRRWTTPVGGVLRAAGLAHLPALLDVHAGRLTLGEALTLSG